MKIIENPERNEFQRAECRYMKNRKLNSLKCSNCPKCNLNHHSIQNAISIIIQFRFRNAPILNSKCSKSQNRVPVFMVSTKIHKMISIFIHQRVECKFVDELLLIQCTRNNSKTLHFHFN